MLKVVRRSPRQTHMDLQTVRETLVYIESDCKACPSLEGVATALGHTIAEIDRVNAADRQGQSPPQILSARFVPARS